MNPNDTHREDLSALIDGALDADRARFLLRRLQHDGGLAGDLSRWQLAGDVLRGQPEAPAPAGFAEAVAARIAGEPAPVMDAQLPPASQVVAAASSPPVSRTPSTGAARWRWFGGGAIAASLAFASLLVLRPGLPAGGDVEVASASRVPQPAVVAPVDTSPAIARIDAAPEAASPLQIAPAPKPASPSPRVRDDASPVRIARASTPVSRPERAAIRPAPAEETPRVALDDSAVAAHAAQPAADPFQPPAARAWPKAAVPGTGAGTFNASLQSDSPYYPFVPRSDAASADE